MAKELKRISFEEFAKNLSRFFRQVVDDQQSMVVETQEGESVLIQPSESASDTEKRTFAEEDYEAFRTAAGGWADVNTDSLKQKIYESRKSSRPPISL